MAAQADQGFPRSIEDTDAADVERFLLRIAALVNRVIERLETKSASLSSDDLEVLTKAAKLSKSLAPRSRKPQMPNTWRQGPPKETTAELIAREQRDNEDPFARAEREDAEAEEAAAKSAKRQIPPTHTRQPQSQNAQDATTTAHHAGALAGSR